MQEARNQGLACMRETINMPACAFIIQNKETIMSFNILVIYPVGEVMFNLTSIMLISLAKNTSDVGATQLE